MVNQFHIRYTQLLEPYVNSRFKTPQLSQVSMNYSYLFMKIITCNRTYMKLSLYSQKDMDWWLNRWLRITEDKL